MPHRDKRIFIGSTLAFALVLTPALAQHAGHRAGQDDHAQAQKANSPPSLPTCPVTGNPVNLAVSTATDDGPVFFCCADCIAKYQADPSAYAAKVAEQRKALADRPKIQVTCPVSRDPVDPEVFVESHGKKVYFCCKGCINKYEADPAKYASALANSYTYQTQCPIMGEDIDPQAFTVVSKGMRVYYCCKRCEKQFLGDLDKYVPNLVEQGYRLNREEMGQAVSKRDGNDDGSDEHPGHDHDH